MTGTDWESVQTGLLQTHVEKVKANALSKQSTKQHTAQIQSAAVRKPMMPFMMEISDKMLLTSKAIDKAFFNEILSDMRTKTSIIQITKKGYVLYSTCTC
jgi:hypothetical protein